jgi:Cdc6-like AAA superfamily ATPase
MNEESLQQSVQNLNISSSVLESVQIGGIAGRDLNLTQIQGGVASLNVFGTVQIAQTSINATKLISQEEYRRRKILLNRVKQDWIEGVLRKSLHTKVLIELNLEKREELVQIPLNEGFFSEELRETSLKKTTATHIFEGIGTGRTLLILGEPGAGKTVTLLKLAESIIARTQDDLSQPLPVVFNLSSWTQQRQSIADWLVQELSEKYHASKSLSKAWVEQEQLILLLDGLDEVDTKYRNACVIALNKFIQEYGATELVVCSRIQDYENLSERLKLRSAIYVQPLTGQQIDQFLEHAGESLVSLRVVLQQNAELREFASSPLILSMMSLAYQNRSVELLTQWKTTEDQKKQLFDAYIEHMFILQSANKLYSKRQTLHWLKKIAQGMLQTSQTVFLIERLQPSWLSYPYKRFRYKVSSALALGLLLGFVGILDALFWDVYTYVFHNAWFPGLTMVFFGTPMLLIGLIYGFVVGFSEKIETVETLKWSWKKFFFFFRGGLSWGLVTGWILYIILAIGVNGNWLSTDGLIFLIFAPVQPSLLLGMFLGLSGGFRGSDVQQSSISNYGIWRSAKNASIIGLLFTMALGFVLGPLLKLPGGLFGGFMSASVCGGSACFRHLILRFMLNRQGSAPWNYAQFLDYAAGLLFVQKVGGGYVFVHRMLLEYFAQIELKSE